MRKVIVLIMALLPFAVHAAELGLTSEQAAFLNDISISVADVDNPEDIIVGKTVRIYATVHNNSNRDQKGVVRFYNEKLQRFMGPDQPFSAVAGGEDTVFIDVAFDEAGESPVAIRIVPDESQGDNPDNNKITSAVVADYDLDEDGTSNRNDPDDDGDGAGDSQDAFPLNAAESQDTDADGVGNNADTDDDGDAVPDTQDAFPQDPQNSIDRDLDGVGDNSDPFPNDPSESQDSDGDGVGDNADTHKNNHGPVIVVASGGSGGGSGGSSRGSGPSDEEGNGGGGNSKGSDTGGGGGSGNAAGGSIGDNENQGIEAVPTNPSKPITGKVDQPVSFDARLSYDPDGEIQIVQWDFGDGTKAEGLLVQHAYAEEGNYDVTITVTDNAGERREQAVPVRIRSGGWGWWVMLLGIPLFITLLRSPKKGLRDLKKSSKIRQLHKF